MLNKISEVQEKRAKKRNIKKCRTEALNLILANDEKSRVEEAYLS